MADLEDIGVISGIGNFSPGGGEITANAGPYLSLVAGSPEYQYFATPLSNKGNPTSYFTNNQIAVAPTTPVRLVNMATGEVVTQGTGYAGAQDAIAQAAQLTATGGNKANWEIQIVPPESNSFQTVAREKANQSFLNQALDIVGDAALGLMVGGPIGAAIAAGASAAGVNVSDIAYPIMGAMIPGLGPIAGAALGSAASSTIQGRSIKDTLIRAGLTAATAGIMEGTGLGNKLSDTVSGALKDIGFKPLVDDVIKNVTSGAITKQAGDEIIATAILSQAGSSGTAATVSSLANSVAQSNPGYKLDQNASSKLTQADPDAVKTTLVTGTPGAGTAATAGVTAAAAAGAGGTNTTKADSTEKSDFTATGTPGAGTPTTAGIGSSAATSATNNQSTKDNSNGQDITATGTRGAGTPATSSLVSSTMQIDPAVQKLIDEQLQKSEETKGLTTKDLIQLGLLTPSLIDQLIRAVSGGGDGGTLPVDTSGVKFTPLNREQNLNTGAGPVSGLGRYGFDPFAYGQATGNQPTEYMFFGKGLGGDFSINTGAGAGGDAGAGGTKADTTTKPITTTTTTSDGKVTVTQGDTTGIRPPGFTGTMFNQKIGDTQVVDGKTYVWGGNDKGWQFLATTNDGKQVLMPGNGATNVTSIADAFKSGLYKQLTPEETLKATALERAVEAAPTAAAATALNPNAVYIDIDAATARALGNPSLAGTVMTSNELQRAKLAADEQTRLNTIAAIPAQVEAVRAAPTAGLTARSYYMDYVTPLASSYFSTGKLDAAGARGLQQAVEPFIAANDLSGAQNAVNTYLTAGGLAAPAMAEGGEVEDDMVKHLIEYRKGGGHEGPGRVKGIGSGQDDKIPAWLSDGEYVWSAQDVADLGDGSTDEGVRRLDRMRQMVRKQAGRKDVKKIAKPQRGIDDMLKAVGGRV